MKKGSQMWKKHPMNNLANFDCIPAMLTRRLFLCGVGVIAGFAAGRALRAQGANVPQESPREGGNTPTPLLQTASTHPMKYYVSLPKGWTADRTWPVLVAPSAHYGDKGRNLVTFAAERDRRKAEFIIVQPVVINADRVDAMTEYRGAVVNAIKATDATTDGRDEAARARFDEEGILAVLKDIRKLYHGEEMVYIAGFSSSTHVAYLMLMNHPELLKGVVINSGGFAGRGVDEAHLPLVNSPERAGVAIKCLVGEKDPHFEGYDANWKETKPKLLSYGHTAAKLQEEIIKSAGHQWFPRQILDFFLMEN